MPNLKLRSERQIQTEMLSVLISELGLNDINPGSVIDILTQAAAQQDFNLYYQIAQVSRLSNINSLSGDDLDLKAFEFGLTRRIAAKATGTITIKREASFTKVSTTFYAGLPSPIAGDTQINVNDASNVLISTAGTLILGRGTNNEEEVTYSAAPVNNTNYYTFTLDAPLTKDHAVEETVILKQGTDEVILAGTVVRVPATGTTEEIQFTLDNDVTLLAGEAEVTGVEVTALEAGTDSNISAKAIQGTEAFPNPPFVGIRAENPAKFTTGRDRETDDELRDHIKSAGDSLTKGVKNAILNAIVGLVDPVTAKRVVSASVILPLDEAGPVKVYIDDGTGFEPAFKSQGFELVRQETTGGSSRLQLDQFPVMKASVETNQEESYNMSSGPLTLIFQVGNIQEQITFNPADFRFPDIGTAEEVVAAINNKATIVEARTSDIGTKVVVTAKADINEAIRIVGGTANAILAFPTDLKETLNLYIDDVKQSKDGLTAVIDSGNLGPYNLDAVGAYPHTLTVIVDGKTANTQTATVNAIDVIDTAAVTVQEIVAVLNRDLVGIKATSINSGTKVRLESLTTLSSNSKIQITGGTLNDATNGLNFDTSEVVGEDNDYIFNRELGIIELSSPLGPNQAVTAGSIFTRGKLRATSPELYAPNDTETLVISVDGGSDQTITFDATFAGGQTAEATADFINAQLEGATAIVREIGGLNYLEINTNTYDITGSIEIKGASTANAAFGFTLDSPQQSGQPNQAYQVSANSGPYEFAQDDSLIVVVDNDIINSAFSVNMSYPGTLTGATSTTVFADSTLSQVFSTEDEIVNFAVGFTSGANTVSGTIESVSDQGAGIARYTFDVAPGTLGDYAAGDLVSITNLNNSGNNGKFVIQAVGVDYIDVLNTSLTVTTGETGDATLGQKRIVSDYNQLTGEITTAAFTTAPSIGDAFVVIPLEVSDVVKYMNNTKISSLSVKANIEGVDQNTKVQISSKKSGSDGYIQITGGRANIQFGFGIDVYRGLQGYNYWTGLIDLVHKTVYGDDTDLISYPGVGAAGITFQILAPTVQQVEVELDVDLAEGASLASLENEIRSAVSGYINALKVGEDVVIERIRAEVIKIADITDVTLSLPAANIAIADNELARISDTGILIG